MIRDNNIKICLGILVYFFSTTVLFAQIEKEKYTNDKTGSILSDQLVDYSNAICKDSLILKFDETKKKYGFVNHEGKYIIKPQYKCATEFINCMAMVTKEIKSKNQEDDQYFINKRNEGVLSPLLEDFGPYLKIKNCAQQ